MVNKEMLKMAVIAGASYALKYKEEYPHADEAEVMGNVTKEMRRIADELDVD